MTRPDNDPPFDWRGRDGYRDEVRDEIRFHLEMRAREFRAEGMDPDDAWRAALDAFGYPDEIEREVLEMKEHRRNVRPFGEIVGSLVQDVRYAARFLVRNEGFAAVAIGTLALGIGATTGIFSVLDAALLREPGVREPETLVAVYTTSRLGSPRSASSYPDHVDYQDRTESLAEAGVRLNLEIEGGGIRQVWEGLPYPSRAVKL